MIHSIYYQCEQINIKVRWASTITRVKAYIIGLIKNNKHLTISMLFWFWIAGEIT